MCIIVDTCCLSRVFDKSNREHAEFAPVLSWIADRDGSFIYGGRDYKSELGEAKRFLPIIAELRRNGRAIALSDCDVDQKANELRARVRDPKFDDAHLVAMVIISRCRVICTRDERAEKYILDGTLYPSSVKKPKLYKNASHKSLCCSTNVTTLCRSGCRARKGK